MHDYVPYSEITKIRQKLQHSNPSLKRTFGMFVQPYNKFDLKRTQLIIS